MHDDARIREADLLLGIKVPKDKPSQFETGEKYLRMEEEHRRNMASMECRIRQNENEPGLQWNSMMLEWIRKAVHSRNEVAEP